MRILYLSYEIKTREINFLREIAYKIISSNSADVVYIGNKYLINKLSKFGLILRGIIFLKSAQDYMANTLKKIKDKRFSFVIQDAESICDLYKKNMSYDLFLKHPTCLKYIETIYTSLDEEHNCLKNYHDICSAKKIGFLRFSYLLNKNYFNNIYKNEINDLKNKYGKYILILTSGTAFKFSRAIINNSHTSIADQGMEDNRWQMTLDWANYSHKNLFSILEFIRIFSENAKDKKIIFRPHPSESKDFYSQLFNGINNVILDDSYSIHASIAASENIILPPCSTTSFEAAILKKNIFYLMPKSKDNLDKFIRNHITTKLGEIHQSPESLFNKLEKNTNKNLDNMNKKLNLKKKLATDFINLNKNSINHFCLDIKNIFRRKKIKKIRNDKKLMLQDLILTTSSFFFLTFINLAFNKKNFSYMKYKLKGYNHDKNKYIKENKIISNVDIGIFEKITLKKNKCH